MISHVSRTKLPAHSSCWLQRVEFNIAGLFSCQVQPIPLMFRRSVPASVALLLKTQNYVQNAHRSTQHSIAVSMDNSCIKELAFSCVACKWSRLLNPLSSVDKLISNWSQSNPFARLTSRHDFTWNCKSVTQLESIRVFRDAIYSLKTVNATTCH